MSGHNGDPSVRSESARIADAAVHPKATPTRIEAPHERVLRGPLNSRRAAIGSKAPPPGRPHE